MNKLNYFTGRSQDKNVVWAAVVAPVAGENDYYIAPDLGNVRMLVEYDHAREEMAVHVEALNAQQQLFTSATPDILCKAAIFLSPHLDEGRNADPEHVMDEDTPFYAGHQVTYFGEMELA